MGSGTTAGGGIINETNTNFVSNTDLNFFKQSHLRISNALPPITKSREAKKRSHNYWRQYQHITIEKQEIEAMCDPKVRGVSRITTKRNHKTLFGEYPKSLSDMSRSKSTPESLSCIKLPSLDTKLGAKSVFWNWNSLSEDLRKGRVSNFHQLKIEHPSRYSKSSIQDIQNSGGLSPYDIIRWETASKSYNYKLSPRYHVQFLQDIHQTRRFGWKGNTKLIKSAITKQDEELAEDRRELDEMHEHEDEFDAILATNISGLDNDMGAELGSGADGLLGDISGIESTKEEDNAELGKAGSGDEGTEDTADDTPKEGQGTEADTGGGLTGIEEIPEPTEEN